MGIAASSAMRDENAADGPAYGSLEALGGPRKLKKKPVLVLDPEELEKAHAMFHDASAELLGEEVERAPKPATILGLAPMEDDDPEEMGASDEVEDDADEDMPSADAVLSLTRRKTPTLGGDEIYGEEDLAAAGYADPDGEPQDDIDLDNRIFPSLPIQPDVEDEEDELFEDELSYDFGQEEEIAEKPAPEAPPEPVARTEEPNAPPPPVRVEAPKPPALEEVAKAPTPAPVQKEAAKPPVREEAPRPPALEEAQKPPVAKAPEPVPTPPAEPKLEEAAKPAASLSPGAAPRIEDPKAAPLPPIEVLHDRVSKQAEARQAARDVPAPAPKPPVAERNDSADKLHSAPKPMASPIAPPDRPAPVPEARRPEAPKPVPPAARPAPEPAPVARTPEAKPAPKPQPAPDAAPVARAPEAVPVPKARPEISPPKPVQPSVPEAFDDAPVEQDKPVAIPPKSEKPPAREQAAAEPTFAEEKEDSSVTLPDDQDMIDGYAFLRDPRSRRSAIAATRQGQQSALRAKLLKEAELEAEAERSTKQRESVVMRFVDWVRSLLA